MTDNNYLLRKKWDDSDGNWALAAIKQALVRLLVRRIFSGLVYYMCVIVSTYTALFVVRELWTFYGSEKIKSMCCEGVGSMRLWCNGKRWVLFFFFGGLLYLYLVYRSPCWQFSEMKERKDKNGMQGRVKPSPVRGVCGCSYLGVSCVGSWLFRGDSVLLFVPCVPGSVRGCDSVSAILLCYVAFVLVPVGRHW